MNVRSRVFAIVLSGFALSGCVPRNLTVTCVMPPLPAELDKDPPPPGWFTQELDRIVTSGQNSTDSPAVPTN